MMRPIPQSPESGERSLPTVCALPMPYGQH